MIKSNYIYFNAWVKQYPVELQICEENEKYELQNPHNMHDKLFRNLLSEPKDLSVFLSKYLNIDISGNELKKYNSSFITKNFENREADIVYKLKNEKVYILIEHQSRIDNSMPYRLLNYNTEIIKDTNDFGLYQRKDYIYAKVIPIVLYTGGRKWNVTTKFSDLQAQYGNHNYLELKYNLIDINNYSKKELLRGDTMIEKAMLLEKAKSEEELTEIIEDILGKINYDDEVQVNKMKQMMKYALYQFLDEDEYNEFISQVNKKSEKEGMSMLHERLARQRTKMLKEAAEEGRQEGRQEGIATMAKKLLQQNIGIDIIQNTTGLTKEEIENIQI